MTKPPSCAGCALATTGEGWVPPTGPRGAKVTFLAEAPGQREAAEGKPLVGEAGAMFHRLLGMLGRNRAEFRLANCLHCRPPRNWLEGAPWEEAALTHCRPNLDQTLAEGSSVVVPMGGVALRSLLGFGRRAKATVKEYHGAVVKEPGGRFWVVPTYHPSHLQRGAHNLTGVVLWDIRRALKVAAEGFTPDEPELVVDPTLEWFSAWVDDYLTRAEEVWLAVDTEFPGKTVQEDEQTPDASWNLTRVNLAWHPDLGVTVPADPPYMRLVAKALASPGVKVFWHHRVDTGRLAVAGAPVSGPIWDAMDATHVLQSDVPRSLGFWAPFYSDAAPWKHENAENPGPYAAKDAAQTLRIMHGAAAHLQQEGQWEVFERHFALFDQWVTVPAETVGLLVDPEELPRFTQRLLDEETRLEGLQKPLVPPELGLTHTWKRRPETDDQGRAQVDGEWYPLQETVVTELVRACLTCGAKEVVPKHRCKDAAGKPDKNAKPQVELVELPVTRWWVQLPFNPQSPPQMLQLLATWKLAPGKDKKTGRPSANKECLVRCRKSAKRPEQREFFGYELDRRAVAKVEGTYATGTIRRLKEQELRGVTDGRLHSSFPNKPSTFRLSCVPLTTEILTARGWKGPLELVVGELVAGYDLVTDSLRWTPLEAVHYGKSAVGMVVFRGHPGPKANGIRCTSGHRWVVDAPGIRGFTQADSLYVGRGNRKLILAAETGLPGGNSNVTTLEAAIIGWAITDGHVKAAKSGNGWYLSVQLAKPKSVADLRELLRAIPHTEHHYDYPGPKGKTSFYIGNKEFTPIWAKALAQPLDQLVMELSVEARLAMYEAMMEADGSRTRGDERFGAQKQPVKDAFGALCAVLGKRVAYKTRQRPIDFSDFHVNQRRYHDITTSCWQAPAEAAPIEEVWCPQTGNGTWIMRSPSAEGKGTRGMGHIVITGNSVDPNLQNVKADKAGGGERPEAGFRRCIVAAPGCSLAELDWAAIEAVMVAWFAGDPVYYRLAKLGVHAYMASHALGKPANLSLSDEELASYFKEIKDSKDPKISKMYNACKRTTHGVSYGLTPYGMNERMPDLFPTIKVATWYQDLFFSLAPKVRAWQRAVQERAAKERSLGGPGAHPFGYKFWFWDVFSYRKITAAQAQGIKARGGWVTEFNGIWYLRGLGTDAKRVVATMPQSGAAGVMRETCLRLFVPGGPSYIGDAWYGQTPLRAIIHDSLLLELPDETRDQIITTVAREMTAPITQMPLPEEWGFGPYVTLGVDIKVGKNWGEMEKWKPGQAPVEVAVDTGVVEYEEEEEGVA